LPGDRFIIVDAKVPDFDFLNALESADDAKRAEALAAHAAKLKAPSRRWPTAIIRASFPTRWITWCCSCRRNRCSARRWKATTI
jgi:hypothetical protein